MNDGDEMNNSCNGCANSGELRNMIEQVAEKAAKQAAENVQRDIKIEMMQLERNLEDALTKKFESKLSEYFGMTPQEHAIEHDRMRKFYSMWDGVAKSVFKKIAITLIVIALGFSGAKLSDFKIPETKAVVSQKPNLEKDKRGENETD